MSTFNVLYCTYTAQHTSQNPPSHLISVLRRSITTIQILPAMFSCALCLRVCTSTIGADEVSCFLSRRIQTEFRQSPCALLLALCGRQAETLLLAAACSNPSRDHGHLSRKAHPREQTTHKPQWPHCCHTRSKMEALGRCHSAVGS